MSDKKLTLRTEKGTKLSHKEMDENFEYLDKKVDEKVIDYNNLSNKPLIPFKKSLDLSNQVQKESYRKSVIALCSLDNTNINLDSFTDGILFFHRCNSIVPNININFSISKKYNVENFIYSALVRGASFDCCKPCIFVKNGKKYGGIEFYHSAPNHGYVYFDGFTNFDIFGLDYYDTRGSVLDEEVYNSLDYNIYSFDNELYFNEERINETISN